MLISFPFEYLRVASTFRLFVPKTFCTYRNEIVSPKVILFQGATVPRAFFVFVRTDWNLPFPSAMAVDQVAPVGDITAQTWEYTIIYGERPRDQIPLRDHEIHQRQWYQCSALQNQMFGYVWKRMNSLDLSPEAGEPVAPARAMMHDHQAPQHDGQYHPNCLNTFPTTFQRQRYTKTKYFLDGVELQEHGIGTLWVCSFCLFPCLVYLA